MVGNPVINDCVLVNSSECEKLGSAYVGLGQGRDPNEVGVVVNSTIPCKLQSSDNVREPECNEVIHEKIDSHFHNDSIGFPKISDENLLQSNIRVFC